MFRILYKKNDLIIIPKIPISDHDIIIYLKINKYKIQIDEQNLFNNVTTGVMCLYFH